MKVTNWTKWTSFKKKFVGIALLTGIALGLCVEEGGMVYGLIGLAFCATSVLVMNTIQDHEW
jgi:hypothetical protein